jgi:hypothetical protein
MKAPPFPGIAVQMPRSVEQKESIELMLHLEYKLLTYTNQ